MLLEQTGLSFLTYSDCDFVVVIMSRAFAGVAVFLKLLEGHLSWVDLSCVANLDLQRCRFQVRRVHIIYVALLDLFIHEKSTFPTRVDFIIGKVSHLPSAGRTRCRCFTVYDLNQRGNPAAKTDRRVLNSVRLPPVSFNCCPASELLCLSLCRRRAPAGQNFLLGGKPMLICLAVATAACDPYFVSTLANPL